MNKQLKTLAVACAIALASTGAAFADGGDGGSGDGGDNSMSQWHGESYAYFHGGDRAPGADGKTTIRLGHSAVRKHLIGDFYTAPTEVARAGGRSSLSPSALAIAPYANWGIGHAFREDTAA